MLFRSDQTKLKRVRRDRCAKDIDNTGKKNQGEEREHSASGRANEILANALDYFHRRQRQISEKIRTAESDRVSSVRREETSSTVLLSAEFDRFDGREGPACRWTMP